MSKRRFRLHAVVCDNSIDYFRYMVANHRALASSDADITVVAHCTDPAAVEAVAATGLAATIVPVFRHPSFFVVGSINYLPNLLKLIVGKPVVLGASSGHAAGLNSAFRLTGGDAYDIMADCDTVIVAPQWDRVISRVLDNVGIIGASYEKIGGLTTGDIDCQTYKDLPMLTWAALSPRFDFRRFDASHRLLMRKRVRNARDSAVFNLPVGYKVLCDVGWKLAPFLARRRINSATLTWVTPLAEDARVLAGTDNYHQEYHFEGAPFLVHQRGSHKYRFKKDPMSARFYEATEDYLASIGAPVEDTAGLTTLVTAVTDSGDRRVYTG